MDGLEEKLGALLGDPSAMGQIQALAEALSGSLPAPGGRMDRPEAAPGGENGPPPLMDGRLTELLGKVMAAYAAPSEAAKLVSALKPWLRPERARRLDKALRTTRLISAARQVLPELLPSSGGVRAAGPKGGVWPV